MDKGSRTNGDELFLGGTLLNIYLSNKYELEDSYELFTIDSFKLWHLAYEILGRDCIEHNAKIYHVISNRPDMALEKVRLYDLKSSWSSGVRFSDEGLSFTAERRGLIDDGFEELPQQSFRDYYRKQEEWSVTINGRQWPGRVEHQIDRFIQMHDGNGFRSWLMGPDGWGFNFVRFGVRRTAVRLLSSASLRIDRFVPCVAANPLGMQVRLWLLLLNNVTGFKREYDTEAETFTLHASLDDWAHDGTADDAVKSVIAAVLLRLAYRSKCARADRLHVLALMALMLFSNKVKITVVPEGTVGMRCVSLLKFPINQLVSSFVMCCRMYPVLGVPPHILEDYARSEALDYISIDPFWIVKEIHSEMDVLAVLRHISCEHQFKALLR